MRVPPEVRQNDTAEVLGQEAASETLSRSPIPLRVRQATSRVGVRLPNPLQGGCFNYRLLGLMPFFSNHCSLFISLAYLHCMS